MSKAIKVFLYSLACLIILYAVLLNIARAVTPLLNRQRPYFEKVASRLLKQPVKIGQLSANWRGFNPEIRFSDVTVRGNKQQRSMLSIDHVAIKIDVLHSLLRWQLLPAQLIIDGADLTIQRNAAGRYIAIGGVKINHTVKRSASQADFKQVLMWLLTQTDVDLSHINCQVVLGQRQFMLKDLRLRALNDGGQHRIMGAVNLLNYGSEPVSFVLHMPNANLDPSDFSAKTYLKMDHVSLSRWQDLLGNFIHKPLPKVSGQVDLQIWSHWRHGQLQSVQANVAAHQLKTYLNLKRIKQALSFERLSGNFYLQREQDGWAMNADHLHVVSHGHTWPQNQLAIRMIQQANHRQYLLRLDYLNLTDIVNIAHHLHLWSKRLQALYQALQPKGELRHIAVSYTQGEPLQKAWKASFDFQHIDLHAWHQFPELNNLSGQFYWAPSVAQLGFNSQNLSINAARYFSKKVRIHALSGLLTFRYQNDQRKLLLDQLQYDDGNLRLRLKGQITQQGKQKPLVDLMSTFSLADVSKVKDYLPYTKHIKPTLRHWLSTAFIRGSADQGRFIWRGPMQGFPYRNHQAQFDVEGQVHHVSLRYHPDWPVVNDVNGSLVFHDQKMLIQVNNAKSEGVSIAHIKASMADLKSSPLLVDVNLKTQLDKAKRFIFKTPLTLAKDLQTADLSGPMKMQLHLKINIHKHPAVKKPGSSVESKGNIIVSDANLNLPHWKLKLSHIDGVFHFHDKQLTANPLEAMLFGAPVRAEVNTQLDAKQNPTIQIKLRSYLDAGALQQLFVQYPLGRYLQGKANYQAQLSLHDVAQAKPSHVSVQSDLEGVSIQGVPAPFAKTATQRKPIHLNVTISQRNLRDIQGHYAGTDFQIKPKKPGWSIDVNNPFIQGNILMPAALKKRWHAVLHYLKLPKGSATRKTVEATKMVAKKIPPLTLQINHLWCGSSDYGQLKLSTSPTDTGLSIDQLALGDQNYHLSLSGWWAQLPHQQRTSLFGNLSFQNAGEAFGLWGYPHMISNGQGRLSFSLRWDGSPKQFNTKTLNGSASLDLENGHFLKVGNAQSELSFGRMINILSIESLPKNIFDIKGLGAKGFEFNFVRGKFAIRNGVLDSQQAEIKGPVAHIIMAGKVSLVHKDYDFTLSIRPYLTSSLPLIVGLAGGPIAGAVTWVVNKMVEPGIGKVAGSTYYVSGPWEHPHIQKLDDGQKAIPAPHGSHQKKEKVSS